MIVRALLFIRLFLSLTAVIAWSSAMGAPGPQAPIQWRTQWTHALFTEAASEHRFVILDLHAGWCHWCHVMDEETYADPAVRKLIGEHYLPVGIDADADPSLTSRYGDWGWPATIVLAADGTEIVKRRGYIPPEQMASLLQAIIDDPSPGPSVSRSSPLPAAGNAVISSAQRAVLKKTFDEAYDSKNGGWGNGQKFIDAPTMEYTLERVGEERDAIADRRARQTLNANLGLIDPVWGGVYQYSATPDWASPHYEKLLSFQSDDLRLYIEAYARWHDPAYLKAARTIRGYMIAFLRSPEGAFYVSQDADLSATVTGHEYYALDDAVRRKLGIPRIDKHEYARENGWAIRALCRLYDVTGDTEALAEAQRSADWVLAHRALPRGGFRHDEKDGGGPYLDDSLSMGQAFVALYRSTGDRRWIGLARSAMTYIEVNFHDSRDGFISAPAPAGAVGVFSDPARTVEQNVAVARLANMLYRYTANTSDHKSALHALKFLAVAVGAAPEQLHTDVLVADHELANAPIHITVVGRKSDPEAQALHTAALGFPAVYLQVDWWDRAEGPLPNPEIQYPPLKRAAVFACTQNTCSTPVFDPKSVFQSVTAALYPE